MTEGRRTSINARSAYRALLAYEVNGNNPPDGRRVMRDHRMKMMAAHQRGESPDEIGRLVEEARWLLGEWGFGT